MKILYLNDTKQPLIVFNDRLGDSRVVAPQATAEFVIPYKEGDGIFVKQWNGQILIGRTDDSAFKNLKGQSSNTKASGEACGNCGCRSKTSCK